MKNEFFITFSDEYNWDFILHTCYPGDEDTIKEIVQRYCEVCRQEDLFCSPVDVMDRIVDDFDGWSWEDDYNEQIEIEWR